TDVIDRGRPAKTLPYPPQNIQIRQSRFHEYDVCALRQIELDFAQSLVGVRRIHLVGTPIAKLRWALRRIAEGSIKDGREFCGITHDPNLIQTGLVEGSAHGANPAVHHIAWSNHIRSRNGV